MMPKILIVQVTFLCLSLLTYHCALAKDLLACAPGEEASTALAICALAYGGCAAASRLAESNNQKRFLLSEGCSAVAGSITGQGYNLSDFLGATLAEVIDSASTQALQDKDPDNDWLAFFGKIAVGIYKVANFAQCVDAATQKCKARWYMANKDTTILQNPAPPVINLEEIVKNTARRHFEEDKRCNIDRTMSFYSSRVYYEYKEFSSDHIRKTKEAHCRKFTNDSMLSIRNNMLKVSNFPNDPSIKVVDYDVDFDVFSKEQQQRLTGTTNVRLAFRTDTETPQIIGEIHKKLLPEPKRCLIGINGENLQYFTYRGQQFNYGVRVVAVNENTPAKAISLQAGDILYRIDTTNISDMTYLAAQINKPQCQTHKLFYIRNDQAYEVTVTPVKQ